MRLSVLLALAGREVRAQLRAPRFYVVTAFYVFLVGFLYGLLVLEDPASALRGLARDTAFLWAFLAPVLGSGCLAGERPTGELEVLRAEPIDELELVCGKWLGLLALLLPLALAPVLVVLAGSPVVPFQGALLACTSLALLLLALVSSAAAIFASTISSHPASAAMTGVVLLGALGLAGAEGARRGASLAWLAGGSEVRALSPLWLLDLLFRGQLDSRPIVLGVGVSLALLWLAARVLGAERFPASAIPVLTGRSLRAILPPLGFLACLHQGALRLHGAIDLAGYLTLDGQLVAAIAGLPEPLTVYRSTAPGVRRDALDDLLDALAAQAPGKVRISTLGAEEYISTLRPLGLQLVPADGLVLRRGSRLRTISGGELTVESRDAERALLDALLSLDPTARRVMVRFSVGHGERPLRASASQGRDSLQTLARALMSEGYGVEELDLRAVARVEASSSVLVLPGPRVPFGPDELGRLRDLVAAGGRVLVLLDGENDDASRALARELGLPVQGGVVVDEAAGRTLAGGGPASLLAPVEAGHPLAAALGPLRIVVPGAISFEARPDWVPLLRSSDQAHRVEPGRDPVDRSSWGSSGTQILGASREGARLAGAARVALIGDCDLATDRIVSEYPGNTAFLASLVAWLAERPPPAAIPRAPLRVRPVIDRNQHQALVLGVAVLPPFLVLLAGFFAGRRYRLRLGSPEPRGGPAS